LGLPFFQAEKGPGLVVVYIGVAGGEGDRKTTYFIEINGRHEETRTPDLYRVKVAL
jgi:hypothetical protein